MYVNHKRQFNLLNSVEKTLKSIVFYGCFMVSIDVNANEYKFDTSMLKLEQKSDFDLSLIEKGVQPPGVYFVDVIVNDNLLESRDIDFYLEKDSAGMHSLVPCFNKEILLRYQIKVDEFPGIFLPNNRCADISAIPNATTKFDFVNQKLLLGIPQAALKSPVVGIASETLWDEGIPAFLLNWQVNTNRSEFSGYKDGKNNSLWSSLEPGGNIGAWRIRNLTTWHKDFGKPGKWETVYTKAERGLNGIKSRLTLGDDYTPSGIFDSVPFRGGMLSSDENMVPYNEREYIPIVRGIARTQARVEVRQNGYLIYSTMVAPGAFALTDIPMTGTGSALQVSVFEADGTVQTFTLPLSTPAIALREGYMKYNMMVGQYRSSNSAIENLPISQAAVMYGLPWGVTVFGGGQAAEHYTAGALGMGLSLGNFGAVSLDDIHARSQNKGEDKKLGNAWRIRYSKYFEPTQTNFSMAGYQYSTSGYYSLPEALNTWYKKGGNSSFIEQRSRRITLALNQSLGNFGYINLTGNRDDYRNDSTHRDSLSMSYGMNWKSLSLNVDLAKYWNNGRKGSENAFNLWVSVPLSSWFGQPENDIRATGQMQTFSGSNTRYEAGLNGRAFDRRLNWGVSEQVVLGNESETGNSRLNMNWYDTYGELTGMYSYGSRSRQLSAGMSGSMVAYSDGIIFGQKLGDNTALIEIPGGSGIAVGSRPGVKTDFRGYTSLGDLIPYQENTVYLRPETFPDGIDVRQTDLRVVPTKGAVVRAAFATRAGDRGLFSITMKDGTPLKFGTLVTIADENDRNKANGIVGDNGEVYMSGVPNSGKLLAQWGEGKCQIPYHLPKNKGLAGIYRLRVMCQ